MATERMSPQRWAFRLTHILNTVLGEDHFPINVPEVAKGLSRDLYPSDPITRVRSVQIPGFEGCLAKAPEGELGWGIMYSDSVSSPGRINFTLAHEFGHYLQHRLKYPDGLQCGEEDLYRWDSEYRKVEQEANVFAANFLMPLDDYRKNLSPSIKADFDHISEMATRYDVSLSSAALRWIDFTEKPAILILSRDGFVLWARSSRAAYNRGQFLRSRQKTVSVPANTLAHSLPLNENQTDNSQTQETSWGEWRCLEHSLVSEQYDFVLTILHLH